MKKKMMVIAIGIMAIYVLSNGCQKGNTVTPANETPANTSTPTVPAGTPTNTFTYTATKTPTATNTPDIISYHFTTDLEGWVRDPRGQGFLDVTYNSDPAYSALGTTGSAQVICDFYSPLNIGLMSKNYSPTINLTGKTIKAYIYVPADLAALSPSYYADIEIHSLEGSYQFGGTIDLNTAGWNLIQWAPTGVGVDAVDTVSILVGRTNPNDWSGIIYIDEISIE